MYSETAAIARSPDMTSEERKIVVATLVGTTIASDQRVRGE